MADFHSPTKTRLVLGYLPRKSLSLLSEGTEPWNRAAWEEIKPGDEPEPITTPSQRTSPLIEKGGGAGADGVCLSCGRQ